MTSWHCRSDYDSVAVPIGKPVANTRIYITDETFGSVPVGVAGELLIGGIQVARGYLQRNELTAASFIDDMFSENIGDKLYRTGDLARFLPDGNIEYLGRRDYQVKMHGLRIELGEIEAILLGHRLIDQVVVVLVQATSGSKELVAYISGSATLEQSSGCIAEIERYLAEKVPTYMIPSRFTVVSCFPQTQSGKIDRKALPVPTSSYCNNISMLGAEGKLERQLMDIWQQILEHEIITVMDNFFDVGGNSLLAIMLVAEINKQFKTEMSVVKFFQFPTIRSFALFMDSENEISGKSLEGEVAINKKKKMLHNRVQRRKNILRGRGKRDK